MKVLDIQKEIDDSKELTIAANELAKERDFRRAYTIQGMATHAALKAILKVQGWLEENFGGSVK